MTDLLTKEMGKLLSPDREGFYSNDPNDRGGETIFGIARRRWPGWHAWAIVDSRKTANELETLKANVAFLSAVEDFYRHNFWEPSGADKLGKIGPLVFDAAVNHGVEQSVKLLQQALNVLNEQGKRWSDVEEDGDFGPQTAVAVAAAMSRFQDDLLWSLITIRGAFYIGLARRDQTQEKYFRGWMKRARELYFDAIKEE